MENICNLLWCSICLCWQQKVVLTSLYLVSFCHVMTLQPAASIQTNKTSTNKASSMLWVCQWIKRESERESKFTFYLTLEKKYCYCLLFVYIDDISPSASFVMALSSGPIWLIFKVFQFRNIQPNWFLLNNNLDAWMHVGRMEPQRSSQEK